MVIWSEEETGDQTMRRIASDVDSDYTYCSSRECVFVEDPEKDEDWDGTEFFSGSDEDDEEGGDIDADDEDEDEDLETEDEEDEEDSDEYN
jgi:hypothetical protein